MSREEQPWGEPQEKELPIKQEQQLYSPSWHGPVMPISRCYTFSRKGRELLRISMKSLWDFYWWKNYLNSKFIWANQKWRQPIWILCQCVWSMGVSTYMRNAIFNSSCTRMLLRIIALTLRITIEAHIADSARYLSKHLICKHQRFWTAQWNRCIPIGHINAHRHQRPRTWPQVT